MKASRLVHYWGPPGAGRRESICRILGRTTDVVGDRDYLVKCRGEPTVVRFSSTLTKFFYRAEDETRPEAVQPAIQQLSRIAGVVFVADSQEVLRGHNIGWLKRLRADLSLVGKVLERVPVVFQLNKRDLPNILSIPELVADLQTSNCDYLVSIATQGIGTTEALERVLELLD